MFPVLQVTGVLLCGALLWSGYPKRSPPLKRRNMARNAMSRTTHRLAGLTRPS
jgi:hypothetical protein